MSIWQNAISMNSQFQIRKALQMVSNAADFLRRHPAVPERTFYRQRSDHPTRMRAGVAARLEAALIAEGLLRQRESNAKPTTVEHPFN